MIARKGGSSRLLKKSLDASATSHAAFGDGSRPGFLNLGGHPAYGGQAPQTPCQGASGTLYPRSCELFSTLLAAISSRGRRYLPKAGATGSGGFSADGDRKRSSSR